jgi:hypothetical protein
MASPFGTTTGSDAATDQHVRTEPAAPSAVMFGDVSPVVRFKMELVACASDTPDEALPHIIALLVQGSPGKRAAIVAAISQNDPLREQWERTWAVLRG